MPIAGLHSRPSGNTPAHEVELPQLHRSVVVGPWFLAPDTLSDLVTVEETDTAHAATIGAHPMLVDVASTDTNRPSKR